MKKYIYSGPDSGVTLRDEKGESTDYMLWHGREVSLPEEHEAVKTLADQGLITPVLKKPEGDEVKTTKIKEVK